MEERSKYWDKTWNYVRGCTPIGVGCRRCYARRNHDRLLANPAVPSYSRPFDQVHVAWDMLEDPAPLHWRKPRIIFVNNLSDTFHEVVPDEALWHAYRIMRQAPQHTFLLLTKRAARMRRWSWSIVCLENLWLGVTCETPAYMERVRHLTCIPAAIRWLSWEPAIEALEWGPWLEKIDWLVAGGETGADTQAVPERWVREARDACAEYGTAFWFKQWGGTAAPPRDAPLLDGRVHIARP
ncbi:MAG: DUF5131 family protein [Armatimonadota bacterium]|nr:DUF5131 family protein [Armatimonadota bacterium]